MDSSTHVTGTWNCYFIGKPQFWGLWDVIWATLGSILQGLGDMLEWFGAAGGHDGNLGGS